MRRALALCGDSMDLSELTISEAVVALRRGDTSAEAYAEALLAQAEQGARLNAFIHHDPTQVRADARAADAARARSSSTLGALHGIPLALKDNLDTAAMPTTGGTPGLRGHRPKRNARSCRSCSTRARSSSARPTCTSSPTASPTTTRPSAPARNPYDPARIPGASSGGVGVAVARAHGARRHRLRHGRLGPHPGGAVRHRRLSAHDRALVAGRNRADLAHARHRRARWRAASPTASCSTTS